MSNDINTNTPIKVPGDVTKVDKRRFRIIPLDYKNIDRAGIGELVANRENGDIYIIDENGEPKSQTAKIEESVQNILNNDLNELSFMYNHNRRVYRLFFLDGIVRLDTNLILDDSCKFYNVQDINTGKFYTQTVSIKDEAPLLSNLTNNEMYLVNFFNANGDIISTLPFSAKIIYHVDNPIESYYSVTDIFIELNSSFLYVGNTLSSLEVKVKALLDDGSYLDVTNYKGISIDLSEIPRDETTDKLNVIGDYKITATWMYNIEKEEYKRTETNFEVRKNVEVIDILAYPRLIVRLNDNSQEIKLKLIAYLADGNVVDVSDKCIVNGFDNHLFDTSQSILVKLDQEENTIERSYTICVNSDGKASTYDLLYTTGDDNNFMKLDTTRTSYPMNTRYFRVRHPENLNKYFDVSYNELAMQSFYITNTYFRDNVSVIVEFYDSNYNFLDADVYSCKYTDSLDD